VGKRLLQGFVGLIVVLVIGAGFAYLATHPTPPADTSESATDARDKPVVPDERKRYASAGHL
jgi:hypothetical protein